MRKIHCVLIGLLMVAAAAMGQGQALSLDDCIEMARESNPGIQAAQNGLRAATYKKRAAIASILPVLKAEYRHTWLDKQPEISIPGTPPMTLSGALPNPAPPPASIPISFTTPGSPDMSFAAGEKEIDNLTLSATQPLFTGGATYHAWMLAKINEADAQTMVEQADAEVVYQVRSAFYGVLKAKEYVTVTNQAVEMAESLRQRSQDFYDVGLIAKNQLLQAEVNLAQARQQNTTAKSGLALAKAALNMLIGRSTQDEVEVRGKLEMPPFSKPMDECVKTALEQRPEVRSARMKADMAEHMIKITRAGMLPMVAAVGSYTRQEGQFGSPPESMSFTIGATWTFWDWGKTYYNVRSAGEVENQARQAVKLTEDQIVLQVKQAYLKLREAEQNISTARYGMTSAEENLRVVKAKFDQNMATSFDVLTAQTMLISARTSEIGALADYMTALAALDRAMGITSPPSNPSSGQDGETTVNPAAAAPNESPAENQPANTPEPPPANVPTTEPTQPVPGVR